MKITLMVLPVVSFNLPKISKLWEKCWTTILCLKSNNELETLTICFLKKIPSSCSSSMTHNPIWLPVWLIIKGQICQPRTNGQILRHLLWPSSNESLHLQRNIAQPIRSPDHINGFWLVNLLKQELKNIQSKHVTLQNVSIDQNWRNTKAKSVKMLQCLMEKRQIQKISLMFSCLIFQSVKFLNQNKSE